MEKNQDINLGLETTPFRFLQHPLQISSASLSKNRGLMDTKTIRGLANSISRFIHLVTCQTMKTVPIQKDYRNMVSALKLLKPVLDEVVNSRIPSDELPLKEFEELDMAVNEAEEFVESWFPKMSKIFTVLQSERLIMKLQRSSLEICCLLSGLLTSSPSTSHLTCIQELQCAEQDRTPLLIEEALRDQRDNLIPSTQHLMRISKSLSLTSNQELLSESIALEKERIKTELMKNKEEAGYIYQLIDLVAHIRACVVKNGQFEAVNGISIPSYFRCPLSMELMLDPVIVASGLTYERAFIQKWLDQGLKTCPKSRQTLGHTNLIPNYTVKALIANWCEDNHIRFSDSAELNSISSDSFSHGALEHIRRADSFRGHSHSSSQSSLEVENGPASQRVEASSRSDEEDCNSVEKNVFCNSHNQILPCKVPSESNPCQSYSHSRSESVSSAISSIDSMPAASSKCAEIYEISGEVMSESPASSPSNKDSGFSPLLSGNGVNHRNNFSPIVASGYDALTTYSHVQKLVEDLKSQSNEAQTAAAAELRLLAKHNMENRIIISKCGAIPLLVSLLYSTMKTTQDNAVTALLNLSINDNNKTEIAEAGAIDPLIHVLKSGNAEAKENSAATLFSLSVLEEYKIKIGRSGAVKALVDLLGSGTLRGKKDAATALFNLSIFHENKARIVQAGAVKYLVELMDPDVGMADKAVALLANLASISEGRSAITREGGIPLLVELIETGSQRGKENAASALMQLCINSQKFCTLVLQEGAVPPLVALSQSGTPRAKEKAQQILSHFRNQREGSVGKVKS
ncbi:ARM repeat superfamily protein isoform X2 [Tasmannia lanceolata]|uniref:ARM repeat superfamily protein isoform X2 n=1 Tax=Tasmannia lanceolata TaxID=3420 RepID=UPI0040633AFB